MQFEALTLLTSNLAGQRYFYNQLLGCLLVAETANSISFQIGQTLLHFKTAPTAKPYHFAINIPAYQAAEAFQWLNDRVSILPYQGQEIVDFSNWNAKAIYFYDADYNIVEFIARRNLKDARITPFSVSSFLEISEIGLPVSAIETTFNDLHTHLGLSIFDGSFDKFCAVGEERGLFIIIDKNKKGWFPLNDEAFSADFELLIVQDSQQQLIHFIDGQLVFRVL